MCVIVYGTIQDMNLKTYALWLLHLSQYVDHIYLQDGLWPNLKNRLIFYYSIGHILPPFEPYVVEMMWIELLMDRQALLTRIMHIYTGKWILSIIQGSLLKLSKCQLNMLKLSQISLACQKAIWNNTSRIRTELLNLNVVVNFYDFSPYQRS